MEIVKIDSESKLPDITVYAIYSRSMVVEILIKCGKKSITSYGNRFLNEILKYASNGASFRNLIVTELNRLAHNNQMYTGGV